MIRLIALPFLALILCAASCEPSDVAYYTALLKGQPTAEQVEQFIADTPADLDVAEDSSSEEVVTVAVVDVVPEPEPEVIVEPEPEPCWPVQWRGNWYSCDMKVLIGPVE